MSSRSSAALKAPDPEPARNCPVCPRLVKFRAENIAAHPDWYNGPAPSFGADDARLLVVGLAPGLQALISAGVGLFCGGTQRTALVIIALTSFRPSSGRSS